MVYRRGNSRGHAIIYVGDGYFLHSTGSSIDKKATPETVMSYTTLYSDNASENADTPVTGEMANGTIYKTHFTYFFEKEILVRDDGNPGINNKYLLYNGAMFGDDRDVPGNRVMEIGVMRPFMMENDGLTKEAEAVNDLSQHNG